MFVLVSLANILRVCPRVIKILGKGELQPNSRESLFTSITVHSEKVCAIIHFPSFMANLGSLFLQTGPALESSVTKATHPPHGGQQD